MPIIGKIDPLPYINTIQRMEIGSIGYVNPDEDFIVTKSAIFVDINTLVFTDEELRDDEDSDDDDDDSDPTTSYVKVSRIGDGLTEEDFDVDVTNYSGDFYLESEKEHQELLKKVYNETLKQGIYIMFPYTPQIKENNPGTQPWENANKTLTKKNYKDISTANLEKMLDDAVENKDHANATAIASELDRRKNK